ncbi:MAG: dephospho-CoA kinase [Actinobacteria bacterium]|nr:dephospho-CoA kinase [Actinomycetota bacterium]
MNKRDAWGSLADELIVVGLTGGIASGKSILASELNKLGGFIIDADEIARRITLPGGPAFNKIVSRFGEAVLTPDGQIDRQFLADIVFKNEEAKEVLENIIHPIVFDEIAAQMKNFREHPGEGTPVVIVDVPLLVETDMADAFDTVIVVDSKEELRIRRLVENKGLTESEARDRIASQINDAVRLNHADIVVENNGDISAFRERAKDVWGEISAAGPEDD